MPSSEVKRIKSRAMPDGTVTGVWLGASRILGVPVPHAPVAERRALAGIDRWPYPHTHGERAMPGHTYTRIEDGKKVVRNADGFKLSQPPVDQNAYVSKRDCTACQVEWAAKRRRFKRKN